jgi:hypothetical protein
MFGDHNEATAFDDTQLFSICCQVDIEVIDGTTDESGCINSLGTIYTNDGIYYTARETTTETPFELQLGEAFTAITGYTDNGVYTGLKFTTNFGNEH